MPVEMSHRPNARKGLLFAGLSILLMLTGCSGQDGEGQQAGAGGIVGFQQPEILGAQPDENVLGGIQDVILAQPVGSEGPAHDGIDQRRSSNDERIPCAFVASGERPQIDLVQFSHATIFLPVRPAV